jgi:UMF1 family MFS transporter
MAETVVSRPAARVGGLSVVSWALYDFANTIFSMNIVSLYFSLWVVNDMGGRDIHYSTANNISMLLMILTAPLLGSLSDQARRRMPFLIASTLVCVLFTGLLGTGGLLLSLAFFVVANYAFQAGLIFYDSLLPVVSDEGNRGKISGLGIGLGYLGSFTGVAAGLLLVETYGKVTVFRVSAILFLLFAIPCFLFVKERGQGGGGGRLTLGWQTLRRGFDQTQRTLRHAREYPGLLRFLIGHFSYTDAVNTVILFMSVYVVNEVGFSERAAQIFLLFAITMAALGSFGWGFVVDRIGPKRSLNLVLILWMVVFVLAVILAVWVNFPALFWGVGALAGIALGGTWASDRVYMLRLSPPKYLGEFYGLYSMAGRFGQLVGPLVWGVVVSVLNWGRPAAVVALLLFVAVAFIILQGVSDRPRDWPAELRGE